MDMNIDNGNRLLGKRDVAARLGFTVRSIERLVAARKIPYVTLPTATGSSTRVKFDRQAIEAWINGMSSPVEERCVVPEAGKLREAVIDKEGTGVRPVKKEPVGALVEQEEHPEGEPRAAKMTPEERRKARRAYRETVMEALCGGRFEEV